MKPPLASFVIGRFKCFKPPALSSERSRPLLPPTSPKKKEGPSAKPISFLPPNKMDWEKEVVVKRRAQMNTYVRTLCTDVLMDTDFGLQELDNDANVAA